MILSFKQSFWAAFLVLAATAAHAQKLPVPGEKNPDWVLRELPKPEQQEMFSYRADPNVRQTMPMMKLYGSQTDRKTGELLTLADPENQVWYDLKKGILHDFKDNKTYQFYKKGEKPKPTNPVP